MIGGVSNTNWFLGSDMQRSSRRRGYKSGGVPAGCGVVQSLRQVAAAEALVGGEAGR